MLEFSRIRRGLVSSSQLFWPEQQNGLTTELVEDAHPKGMDNKVVKRDQDLQQKTQEHLNGSWEQLEGDDALKKSKHSTQDIRDSPKNLMMKSSLDTSVSQLYQHTCICLDVLPFYLRML